MPAPDPYSPVKEARLIRELIVAIFRINGRLIETGNHLVYDIQLSSALWQVLDALDRAGEPLPVSGIGRHMGLTRQSVQRVADVLAERGFVSFSDNPHHRRARLVNLTGKGVEALALARERERPLAEYILTSLGTLPVGEALTLLNRMDAILAAETDPKDDPS